jgi:hypothetical protein
LVAGPLVRLLAAVIDVVADGYDPLEGEESLRSATTAAAVALRGLAEGDPEPTAGALADLTAIVAELSGVPA